MLSGNSTLRNDKRASQYLEAIHSSFLPIFVLTEIVFPGLLFKKKLTAMIHYNEALAGFHSLPGPVVAIQLQYAINSSLLAL